MSANHLSIMSSLILSNHLFGELNSYIFVFPTLQNLICSECGDEFVLQSQLSLHLEEHRKELSGIKVYTCKTCDKEFKMSAHLREHMKSHVKMRLVGVVH